MGDSATCTVLGLEPVVQVCSAVHLYSVHHSLYMYTALQTVTAVYLHPQPSVVAPVWRAASDSGQGTPGLLATATV